MLILIALYVLIGNARSIQENPIIPGAVIAVNMIVPVIGGILFGWRVGLAVGLFGTLFNAFSPAGNEFELHAVIPHGVMGFTAGYLRDRLPTIFAACSIIVGHFLNIATFLLFNLITFSVINSVQFWYGLAFESLAGIITIVVSIALYRVVTQYREHIYDTIEQ